MRNKHYEKTKKNGGVVPAISDTRALWVQTKCGKCIECRTQKANDWIVRLNEDIRHHKHANFVTLTFSNEEIAKLYRECENYRGYERDNKVAKLAVRRFYERWRKKYKVSIRHWLVTELGHNGTENLHLHGILYTEHWQDIAAIWKYGFVWNGYTENGRRVNYVNEETIAYATKYVKKQDEKHPNYDAITLATPGIGAGYIDDLRAAENKFNGENTREYYRTRSGKKIKLPDYYRKKLYNDEQREQLWMQKLDKGEKWICGEKYRTEWEYWLGKEWHRQRAKELGYGDGRVDTEAIKWEEQRRQIAVSKRIEAGEQRLQREV